MVELSRTPRAIGAASVGLISPSAKEMPTLSGAITPIMRLLAVVETFMGKCIILSACSTKEISPAG
jgi:hypothetical protein